jgi:hypothetical protein
MIANVAGAVDREKVDRAILRAATQQDWDVAKELSDKLGLRLTAAIGRVSETRRVREWISGGKPPRRAHALRAALQATAAISAVYGPDTARSWFMSTNPGLGMRSPLVFLRNASSLLGSSAKRGVPTQFVP